MKRNLPHPMIVRSSVQQPKGGGAEDPVQAEVVLVVEGHDDEVDVEEHDVEHHVEAERAHAVVVGEDGDHAAAPLPVGDGLGRRPLLVLLLLLGLALQG